MTGHILLAGGAEFNGEMAQADRRAIELAGGDDAPICIIPTALAPGQRFLGISLNGIEWFRRLGAKQVDFLPILDKKSANNPHLAQRLSRARLIYFPDGFMGYLGRTLAGSSCWKAMLSAYKAGAVIAGSSAGAMVLCEYFYDPAVRTICKGLGLLPNTCLLPHHDIFGKGWVPRLTRELPGTLIVGIDEQTAMINDAHTNTRHEWSVYGQGTVTLYRNGTSTVYTTGKPMHDSPREQILPTNEDQINRTIEGC